MPSEHFACIMHLQLPMPAACTGELLAGSVQWLTTGRGLVHRELPNDSLLANGGTWEGFQLWVNLPAKVTLRDARCIARIIHHLSVVITFRCLVIRY